MHTEATLSHTTRPLPIFALNETVELTGSGEQGLVIGRAEYLYAEHGYLVRYTTADGRLVEAWWGESALQSG